jgi:hypothetical protein
MEPAPADLTLERTAPDTTYRDLPDRTGLWVGACR